MMRSLATLMGAGIPIGRAMSVLAKQADEKAMADVCRLALNIVEGGQPLSLALYRSSPAFSTFQLRLIRVGEASGQLVHVLQQVASFEERQRALKMRVLSVLTYPLALFAFCMLMMLVGVPLLLKGQLQLLQELGTEPPLITRMLFALTDMRVVLLIVAIPLLGIPLLNAHFKTPGGRLNLYRFLLRLPRFGILVRMLGAARFAQALALQLRVGMGLLEALPNAVSVSGNPVLEHELPTIMAAVRDGRPVAQSLELARFFPRSFLLPLKAGEASGSLPDTLDWLARLYQMELEALLEMTAAALEPLLMMLMGVAGAIVALGTLLPMVRVIQSL